MNKASAPRKPRLEFSRTGVARYSQLASLFRRRIESGEWKVGEQIPTVDDLAAECGVARATMRQALGILEAEGLIERFRAKGTFVKHRPHQELWCEVATDWSGLLRAREGALLEVLSDRPRVKPPSLILPVGTLAPSYRHLRRRHWRDDQPFLLADVYIDERLRRRIPSKAIETKTALRLVADIPGIRIRDAHQVLTIGSADVETAKMLQIPLNAPVAYVHRFAVDQSGVVVMIGYGIYRGDVVRIDVKLR